MIESKQMVIHRQVQSSGYGSSLGSAVLNQGAIDFSHGPITLESTKVINNSMTEDKSIEEAKKAYDHFKKASDTIINCIISCNFFARHIYHLSRAWRETDRNLAGRLGI